jgi:hypothetical protein
VLFHVAEVAKRTNGGKAALQRSALQLKVLFKNGAFSIDPDEGVQPEELQRVCSGTASARDPTEGFREALEHGWATTRRRKPPLAQSELGLRISKWLSKRAKPSPFPVHVASLAEEQCIRTVFDALDADRANALSMDQFMVLFALVGEEASEKGLEDFLHAQHSLQLLQKLHAHALDYRSFVDLMQKCGLRARLREFATLWTAYDRCAAPPLRSSLHR